MHAHLAFSPAPPSTRNPAVPQVLSEIVLRLLAKMPEQRYQSSEALLADLREARRQWRSGHNILPFELGRLDIAQGLLEPAGLYGRAPELAALTAAVERVRGGACELLVISGPAGIGKSRLVQALKTAVESRALFVAGKSDPLQVNVPFAALTGPLRALLRELLRQPALVMDRWRTRLGEALGTQAGVIGELIPELRLLLADAPPPPAVGPVASENRVRLTLQALVQALGDEQQPLVLVLDDAQWADSASLAVLVRLVTTGARHLLALGVYRNDDVGEPGPGPRLVQAARQAGATAAELPLATLNLEALAALCAEALRCPARAGLSAGGADLAEDRWQSVLRRALSPASAALDVADIRRKHRCLDLGPGRSRAPGHHRQRGGFSWSGRSAGCPTRPAGCWRWPRACETGSSCRCWRR